MKVFFLFFLLIPLSGISQPEAQDYPRDTSFTVYGAFQKIKKEFPEVWPIEPFESEYIPSDLNRIYRNRGNRKISIDFS